MVARSLVAPEEYLPSEFRRIANRASAVRLRGRQLRAREELHRKIQETNFRIVTLSMLKNALTTRIWSLFAELRISPPSSPSRLSEFCPDYQDFCT